MVSKNSKPAQGTIEYLVIIAVVVVVALVVVGLLISLSAPGAQVSQVAGKLNAEVQTISVLQAIAGSDGNGVLVIKNSSGDGITITKITIGDSNQDVSAYFAQGDLRSIQLNKLPLCKPGVTKIYSIKINYTSSTGLAKTQTIDNVSIGCEATAITQNPINILPDTAPPTITLSFPAPGFTTTLAQIDFNFIVSDQNTIRDCNLIIDGIVNGAGMSSPVKDTNLTFTRSGLSYVAHTWDVNCVDATGNRATSGQARTFYPMAAPVVYLSSPIRDTNSTQTGLDFNFFVSDADGNVNSCSFILDGSINGASITSPTKDTNLTFTRFGLTVGAHTWDVNCTDANSNIGASNLARPLNMISPLYFARKVTGSNNTFGANMYLDSYGNMYVSGTFSGAGIYHFDSIDINSSNPDGNNSTGYIGKMNSDGNWSWVTKMGAIYGGASGKTMGIDSNGNMYFAGGFTSRAAWFGPYRLDCNYQTSTFDIYVAKLSSDGNTWLWARRYGGTNLDEAATAILTDSVGNSYITGRYRTTWFDSFYLDSNGTAQPDAFIGKMNSDGNWVWATRLTNGSNYENGQSISFGPDGNLYVVGNFSGSFSGNSLSGPYNFDNNGAGSYDVFVAKVSLDGNIIWVKKAGGSGSEWMNEIALGSDGNFYLTGYFSGNTLFGSYSLDSNATISSTNNDVLVAKMDPTGNWLWAKKAGGSYGDTAAELALDSSNNVYVTGIFNGGNAAAGSAIFDSNVIDSNGTYQDIFVSKINSAGNWLWAKKAGSSYSSPTFEKGMSLAVDSRGIPYTTGGFYQTSMFDTTQLDSNSLYSTFIWKLNPTG